MKDEVPRIAVNIVVVRNGQVLLGKRRGKVGEGCWGYPGGKLEFYEALEACAHRELAEETGLVAGKMTFLNMINDPRPDEDQTHWLHIQFLAEAVAGEPKLTEPDKFYEWRWFSVGSMPEVFLGHRLFLDTYLNRDIVVDCKRRIKSYLP